MSSGLLSVTFWIPGGRVFIGNSDTPLGLGHIAQLQPGSLIRILPKGKPLTRCVPIARKIASPDRWLREASQVPTDRAVHRHIGLVGVMGTGPLSLPAALRMYPAFMRPLRSTVAARQATLPLLLLIPISQAPIFAGRQSIPYLQSYRRLFLALCILFLDARVLAVPITALILPFAITSLDHVLQLAGGSRPEDVPLRIEGIDSFDYASGRFYPVRKAVGPSWPFCPPHVRR